MSCKPILLLANPKERSLINVFFELFKDASSSKVKCFYFANGFGNEHPLRPESLAMKKRVYNLKFTV